MCCFSKKACVLMIIGVLSLVCFEYMIWKQVAEDDQQDQQEWCKRTTPTYWDAHDKCFDSPDPISFQCRVSHKLEADLVKRCGIIVR